MQLVVVKFRDPTTFNHWATMEEIDKSACRVCYAHGVLLEDNDRIVKVSLLSAEDRRSGSDWIDIPAGCVISIDVIKEIDWADDG